MPSSQALCLRIARLREMLVAEGAETVCGGTCNGVHEDCEVARLRLRGIAAVAHAHGHVAPDAAVAHRLEGRAPRV